MRADQRKRRTGVKPASVQSKRATSTKRLMAGPSKARKATKMTGAQRNSLGGRSEWAMSMTVTGTDMMTVNERRWSQTDRNRNV